MEPLRSAAVSLVVPLLLAGVAGAQDQVYVTEYKYQDPALRSMDLDGGNVADLFAPGNPIPATDWLTVGLALDEAAGKIYWLHGSTPGLIRRANLDGSGQELLVSGLRIPRGLSLDLVAGKMYWAASPPSGNAGGMIQRANLDGTGVETVYLDPNYDPTWSKIGRPTVDAVNGWVYFASNKEILRTNLAGPPFETFVAVTGVSTARSVALDVAGDHIYWLGADTIEDVVCRARLDNSEFTVVWDLTPDSGNTNGLSHLVLDLPGSTYLLCDDLRDEVWRGDLAGTACQAIYTAPAGFSPSAMTLNADVVQPMLDCNSNGVPDVDDVLLGTSLDCNANGIPDECEVDPCVPPAYLLDQGTDPGDPNRALGGAPTNQQWMIFQPFDVPPGGWQIGELQLHGTTWTYRPEGFTATIFPDTGSDYPDENSALTAVDAFFRFAAEWVSIPISVSLPEGRHWVRLRANDNHEYVAAVSTVSTGPASFSRSGLGNDFFGQPPIALRLIDGSAVGTAYCFGDPGSGTPCPCNNDNDGSVPGSGCANGVFASGAKLIGSGTASLTSDTLVLSCSGLEPSNSGLYFQANNDLSPGNVWGDGLQCAGGQLKRLGVRFADASGYSDTSAWATSISVKAGNITASDTKRYQCWYRTTVDPPCGAGVNDFNASNGLAVTWAP